MTSRLDGNESEGTGTTSPFAFLPIRKGGQNSTSLWALVLAWCSGATSTPTLSDMHGEGAFLTEQPATAGACVTSTPYFWLAHSI